MSNLINLVIFLISALCIAYGIYYNLIVSIVVGIVGVCYAVYMHNTLKEEEKNNVITAKELEEALVKIEQETAPPVVSEPLSVVAAPVSEVKPKPPVTRKPQSSKAPVPAIKAANADKAPPKKRGRKPTKK